MFEKILSAIENLVPSSEHAEPNGYFQQWFDDVVDNQDVKVCFDDEGNPYDVQIIGTDIHYSN